MHIDFDKYAYLKSPIHKWDIRFKITSLAILIISFSFIHNSLILVLSLPFVLSLILFSKLPFNFVLKTLKGPLLFFGIILIFLPLTASGNKVYLIGNIRIYHTSLALAVTIILRGFLIIVCFIIMFSTAKFEDTVRALHNLKIPKKLVSIILFTYRYIFLYKNKLRDMNHVLTVRGFQKKLNFRSFKILAGVIVNLLIQSFEQTERVYQAMILRGYDSNIVKKPSFNYTKYDILKTCFFIFISVIIIILEVAL